MTVYCTCMCVCMCVCKYSVAVFPSSFTRLTQTPSSLSRANFSVDWAVAMIDNTVKFVIETKFAVCIQKYARGYIQRAYHPLPWPPPPHRPQRAKRPHDLATYRRMWARSKYIPKVNHTSHATRHTSHVICTCASLPG